MESTIRSAVPGDAARLRRLQAELSEPAPKLLDAAIAQIDTTDSKNPHPRAASPAGGFTLLVSVDKANIAVGYLLALAGETIHIAELAVDPGNRREGRANALLTTLIERGEEPITVHVAVDNRGAKALYQTLGFHQQARSDDQFEHAAGLTLRYPAAER